MLYPISKAGVASVQHVCRKWLRTSVGSMWQMREGVGSTAADKAGSRSQSKKSIRENRVGSRSRVADHTEEGNQSGTWIVQD